MRQGSSVLKAQRKSGAVWIKMLEPKIGELLRMIEDTLGLSSGSGMMETDEEEEEGGVISEVASQRSVADALPREHWRSYLYQMKDLGIEPPPSLNSWNEADSSSNPLW